MKASAAERELWYRRECTPETAHLVRELAPGDRRVLPRWHVDDTGVQNRSRGVHYRASAKAYAKAGVWRSWPGRENWLIGTLPTALAVHAGELKTAGISRQEFTRWAEVETLYCAGREGRRTGRRCIVRPSTVADVAEMHERTVQKCRALAGKLGLRVVVFAGRMLNVEEKTAAYRRGSLQRGLSAEAAFTVPSVVENRWLRPPTNTPTRGRAPLGKKSRSSDLTYRAASGESKETASPPRPKRRRRPPDRRAVVVARDLQAQVPFLRGSKLSEIIPSVHKCATNALMPWTARDVIQHMDSVNQARGFTSITAAFVRTTPAAVLAWYLRGVDPQADHPRMGPFLRGTAVEQRPPWCGVCDQNRHVEVPGGLARCPRCHPLADEQPW